jgi:2-polyprenyl-3-methyl-5-hydroxy-6-metoxy-1,4-benzoquinol methylase
VDDKLRQWHETQEHWDDRDFLAKEATALMKKKWARLNKIVSKIVADEVVLRNEYVNFLDIGSGRGDFYRVIEDMVKKYKGIEPSAEMLKDEIIEEEFEIRHGTGEELAEENLYDVCLLKEVLDHTYGPEKVIVNAHKALKDGGLIIVTLTNRESYYKLMFKKKAKELEEKHRDHLHNFSPSDAASLLSKAGFTIEKNLSINYLKLPRPLENVLGSLGEKTVFGLLDMFDGMMRPMLAGKGGGFVIAARKGAKPGGPA